ncbi:GrpB family protein [Pseudalkalibacillus hwajinpoensis]|uniref:GrpB family protein n=1 Tax=Guptibacillus hwajinpoensis TaxID=208199 RepID=UPI00325A97BC
MTKPIVTLKEYNPEWKLQFEDEKNRIIGVLRKKVIGIEHFGSTSITGLEAKPIIDILLGVQDFR